jgi:hypothetical protein
MSAGHACKRCHGATMYAKIETWRLAPEIQGDEAYEQFVRALAQRNTPILRNYGLLDGFAVRVGPDSMLTMNLYEDAAHAEAAWGEVIAGLSEALKGQLTLLDRMIGPAVDMPMLLDEV